MAPLIRVKMKLETTDDYADAELATWAFVLDVIADLIYGVMDVHRLYKLQRPFAVQT